MPSAGAERDLAAALAGMWESRRATFAERASTVEAAVAALLIGALSDAERAAAVRDAHKLAGALGTFGLPGGTELARELESAFEGGAPPAEAAPRLAELVLALQREIARGPVAPAAPLQQERDGERAAEPEAPELLVVTADDELADRLASGAAARGFAAIRALDEDGARAALARRAPAAVVADLDFPPGGGLAPRAPGPGPALPVVALSAATTLADRLRAAQHGVSVFLERRTPPGEVIAIVSDAVERTRTEHAGVVVVDDDEAILDAVTALLAPEGVEVTGVSDAACLWDRLGEACPDLIVLDVDMPGVDGIDLCRVLRGDPRFAEVPVLFLTGHKDPALLARIFAAGGDDYVAKPIVAAELVGRIRNRLERARLMRQLADRDAVTGVANRRKASVEIIRSIGLAERQGQQVSLAVLDVDRFKAINDRHGHATGDAVLRALGDQLARSFRREDTVGRWGGEEFVVCLYGAGRRDAMQRIEALLERFRAIELPSAAGAPVRATFSAGVATYPEDANEPQALHRAADAALYAAKAAGRARVLPAGWRPQHAGRVVDVVVVEDDDTLGDLLTHALETRGYATARLADGAEAAEALGGATPRVRGRVALMDVDLPGLDGLSLLRRLARDGALAQLRVIMLTARAAETEVLQALELGAVDHVAKPFSVPVLLQRVQHALALA